VKLSTLKYIWFATILALLGVLAIATSAKAEMADDDDEEYVQRIGYLRQNITLAKNVYPTQRTEYRKAMDVYYENGFKDKETPLSNVVSDVTLKDKLNTLYAKPNVVVQRYVIGF